MRICKTTFVTIFLMIGFSCFSQSAMNELKRRIVEKLIEINPNQKLIDSLVKIDFPQGHDTDLTLKDFIEQATISENEVSSLLSAQLSNGSWPYIDYTDQSRSAWKPIKHSEALLKLAKVYRTPGNIFFENTNVSKAIHKGLKFWFDEKLECPNWWYNTIGVPKLLVNVMLLIEDELTSEEKRDGFELLDKIDYKKWTGQNLVWCAGITFINALLQNNETLIKQCSNAISSQLFITTEEGIQPDFSFHQHGAQIQFGNYGLSFVQSMTFWARILNGSPFDFSFEEKRVLQSYIQEGLIWTFWRGNMDISSCGRQLLENSPQGKAGLFMMSLLDLSKMDILDNSYYTDFVTSNYSSGEKYLTGQKHFWRSDFTVQRNAGYMASVKMHSNRVSGGEMTNNQNLKGYYLSDGTTLVYIDGDEYSTTFPVWNWRRLPGTTIRQSTHAMPRIPQVFDSIIGHKTFYYKSKKNFVGGVSNGKVGVSVLDYERDSVSAKKSWFFLGNQIICLGADLKSESKDTLVTTVQQSKLKSDIIKGKNWVHHGKIGYAFLQQQNWEEKHGIQTGNMHDIADFYPKTKIISQDVFQLYITHEVGKVASYAYSIFPAMTLSKFKKSIKSRNPKILINKNSVQAIEEKGKLYVVFYEPTSLKSSFFGKVEVSEPCLLMMEKTKSGVLTTVSDPTQKMKSVRINIANFQETEIIFPDDKESGKSVTKLIKK